MAAIASTPRSGREPCAATPAVSTSSHRKPLWATHTSSAVGSVTIAASAHTLSTRAPRSRCSRTPRRTPPVTITSPAQSRAGRPARPASMIAASPPFMSKPPLPWSRPFSIRGEKGRACPRRRPRPCARSGAATGRRPCPRRGRPRSGGRAATSRSETSSPARSQPAGRELRDRGLAGAARHEVGVDRVDRNELRDELGYRVHAGSSSIQGKPGSGARSGCSRNASWATPSARRGAGRE